jgi:hypothetical protein
MDDRVQSTKKKLIYNVISMSCILGLVIFSLIVLPNGSSSWFAKNQNVKGNGMGIGAEKYPLKIEYARYDTETMETEEFSTIDIDSQLNFLESDMWYPGYSVVFKLRITNVGDSPVSVSSVGFCAPDESEEVAREVDGASYYLGTQLSAAVIAIDETAQNSPTERRLLTIGENGELNRVDLALYNSGGENVLSPSNSILLTVRITFINDEVNSQDMYRNFGRDENALECCQRRLFVTYLPIE